MDLLLKNRYSSHLINQRFYDDLYTRECYFNEINII
ncbi:hypothetical protein NTHI1209_01493 [Haemophilus influenzae]|uniref:Uncharacterized protein n=1 Tax=Haemophilus influenzae TaxID=727 RepID=A0A158SYD1_HAEIF|nr:hypothetical protein NTHI1209_01493 [Haemophilus influenzae]